MASSLRCLSQSCTVHRHSFSGLLRLSAPLFFFEPLLCLFSFFPSSGRSGRDTMRHDATRRDGTGENQSVIIRADKKRDKREDAKYSHAYTVTHRQRHPTEAHVLRKHDLSTHGRVDCRGAASHARTIRRYTSPYLVEFYKLGSYIP